MLLQTQTQKIILFLSASFKHKTNRKNITGKVEIIHRDDTVGPECLVPKRHKGKNLLFLSLGDGRISRLTQNSDGTTHVETLVRTGGTVPINSNLLCKSDPYDTNNNEKKCGRPLGMTLAKRSQVDPDYNGKNMKNEDVLLVTDAYIGLLMVDSIYEGGKPSTVKILATRANDDDKDYTFSLLNAITKKGNEFYFTETSTRHIQRRRIFYGVLDGRATGRLLKYTKADGVQILATGIYMPNGITLSHNKRSLKIVSGVQVLSYSLDDNELAQDPFIESLPGTGDNIEHFSQTPSGKRINCYWAGLGSKYSKPVSLIKLLSEKPILKSILCTLVPYKLIVELIPKLSALSVYSENGELLEIYRDYNAVAPWLSEGRKVGSYIYLGSWYNNFLARMKQEDL